MASSAIQKFYDAAKATKARATKIVRDEKAARPIRRIATGLTGTAACALAGWVDGRMTSQKGGVYTDGAMLGPVPVMPIVGAAVGLVGVADVIPGSDYVAAAGFSVANGWVYSKSKQKGVKDMLSAAQDKANAK